MIALRVLVISLLCLAASCLGDEATKEASIEFLLENSEKDDVIVLDSGLQYKVLSSSADPNAKTPAKGSLCRVHYRGSLIDGHEFDSNLDKEDGSIVSVSKVMKGWQEALSLMQEGDKWQVFIPADLAYGDKAVGETIPADSALVFELHLTEVDPEFEGWEKVKMFFMKEIPGAPFNLTVWQGTLLICYLGLRIYLKNYMSGGAAATKSASTATAVPAAKKGGKAKESKKKK